MAVDAEELVNALSYLVVAELRAIRDRLAEVEEEVAKLRRQAEADR